MLNLKPCVNTKYILFIRGYIYFFRGFFVATQRHYLHRYWLMSILILSYRLQWNFKQDTNICFQQNMFQNVVFHKWSSLNHNHQVYLHCQIGRIKLWLHWNVRNPKIRYGYRDITMTLRIERLTCKNKQTTWHCLPTCLNQRHQNIHSPVSRAWPLQIMITLPLMRNHPSYKTPLTVTSLGRHMFIVTLDRC